MTEILTLDIEGWRPALSASVQDSAVRALEGGGVVVLPHVRFELTASELALFIEGCELIGRRRLSPGIVKPIALAQERSA